jgi:AcrR family transcriptional regulator
LVNVPYFCLIMSKEIIAADTSTEQNIKDAAKRVFLKKGYAATTTREIAEEAGINHGMLNYYFRSKDRLFDMVAQEQTAIFFGKIYPIVNDEATNLEEKIDGLVKYYTGILAVEPGLALFISNEMQNRPERIAEVMAENKGLAKAIIARQLKEARPDFHPMQLLMSILGMILFPYISRGVFQKSMEINEDEMINMLKERAEFLPVLIKAMLVK